MSKPEIKGRAKEIYIVSKEKPSINQIKRQLEREGLKVTVKSICEWVKKDNWERLREEKVNKTIQKVIDKQSTRDSNEVVDSLNTVNNTILQIQKAMAEARDTGTKSALAQSISSLLKIKELVEGKATERYGREKEYQGVITEDIALELFQKLIKLYPELLNRLTRVCSIEQKV